MATHSSILAWRILWTEDPGGLPFMGSQSWTRLKQLSMHACMPYLTSFFLLKAENKQCLVGMGKRLDIFDPAFRITLKVMPF